jgi:hypothetical protein
MIPNKPFDGMAPHPVVVVGAVVVVGVRHTAGLPAWRPHVGHAPIP